MTENGNNAVRAAGRSDQQTSRAWLDTECPQGTGTRMGAGESSVLVREHDRDDRFASVPRAAVRLEMDLDGIARTLHIDHERQLGPLGSGVLLTGSTSDQEEQKREGSDGNE